MDSDHIEEEELEIIEEGPMHDEDDDDDEVETFLVEKAKRRRSRIANPELWLANVRKQKRASGQPYVNSKGKIKMGREVREKDCSRCPRKCNTKVSDEERQKIFSAFWGLADSQKQKLFISTLIEEVPVKHVRSKNEVSRRSATRLYFLRCGKEKKVPVCQGFFLATLDISEAKVRTILKCRDETSYFIPEDRRGRMPSHRARPEENKDFIRDHIRLFVEQHPGNNPVRMPTTPKKRKNAKAEPDLMVVAPGVNICRMYKAYEEHCNWHGVPPEKAWLYRQILKTEFNIAFMDPNPRTKSTASSVHIKELVEVDEVGEDEQVYEDEEGELEEEVIEEIHEEVMTEPIQVYVHQAHTQVAQEVIIPANTLYINTY